jgi:hypothetical protein
MRSTCLFLFLSLGLLAGCASRPASNQARNASSPGRIVVLDEDQDRGRFGHRARVMLAEARYDDIERMADSLQATGVCWSSGAPKVVSFASRGFSEVDDPTDANQWSDLLQNLRTWAEARPASRWASLALAEALTGRGWEARGGKWARNVSDGQFRRMLSDLDEATQILGQCPQAARGNPLWYEAMLRAHHGLGPSHDAAYRELLTKAIARFPTYHRFYVNGAIHLMPRWYGAKDELANFAYGATRALPDSLADEYYARVMVDQCNYSADPYAENEGANWVRTRHGLELWKRHWPASTQPTSALAMLGYLSGNRGLARHAFLALGDTLELEVWRGRANYDLCRQWAFATPVAH